MAPDVYFDSCGARKGKREILLISLKGGKIADVVAESFFSAIQEMIEIDLGYGIGVDASVDEAVPVEAASERRIVFQALWIR